MTDFIARYAKAFTALFGAVATALTAALADGSISGADWLAIILAIVTPAGVAGVANRSSTIRVKPSISDTLE